MAALFYHRMKKGVCKMAWYDGAVVRFYDRVDDALLKFAVIIAKTDGKWVFCKHKERDTYEIPGGFIKRPCNGEEEPALRWADITAENHGVSIFTDSKYSYDCPGNTLRLTMLRNSIFADHYSDRPDADFAYCDEGLQRFEYGIYPHSGEAQTGDLHHYARVLCSKPQTVPVGYHKGDLPLKKSYISIDKDNLEATAFKLCEDGSGDYILRIRETQGRQIRASIVCDIIEAGFYADFSPLEIKTFRIDKEGYASETNFLEGIVK